MAHHVDKFTAETFPEHPERATLEGKNKFIGFWLFLGAEVTLFTCLFATFIALRHSNAGGPTTEELFKPSIAFIATMLLLFSSLTSVYAIHHMKNFDSAKMQLWFVITALLGAAFLGLEIYEFNEYVHEGFKFSTSGLSTAFYTLVGTHGGHVTFGLLWFVSLLVRNGSRGITPSNAPKFYLASLYWHFIDVVWVFIFTVVYLMGMVG